MKLLLCLILLVGCANQHIIDARDISVPDVKVSFEAIIYFDTYNRDLHNRIALVVERLPQVHDWLNTVYIVDEFDNGGRCNWFLRTITVKIYNWPEMERILWHELGHALQNTNLTCEQYDEWVILAGKRLNAVGLNNFLGNSWGEAKSFKDFPTKYALKSIWEFMADCFSQYHMNKNYVRIYPEECNLMRKCGWIK